MNQLLTKHIYKSGEFESTGPGRGSLPIGSRGTTTLSRIGEVNIRRGRSVLGSLKGGGIELKCMASEDGKSTHHLLWNTRIDKRYIDKQ